MKDRFAVNGTRSKRKRVLFKVWCSVGCVIDGKGLSPSFFFINVESLVKASTYSAIGKKSRIGFTQRKIVKTVAKNVSKMLSDCVIVLNDDFIWHYLLAEMKVSTLVEVFIIGSSVKENSVEAKSVCKTNKKTKKRLRTDKYICTQYFDCHSHLKGPKNYNV